jgi:hypothetical protein
MRSMIALSVGLLLCAPLSARAQALVGPAAVVRPDASPRPIFQNALASLIEETARQDADWQERRADAEAKRRSGIFWMLVGGGAAAVGTLMAINVEEECSASVCTLDYRLPVLLASSGAGLATLGVIRYREGGRMLGELDAQRGVTGATAPPRSSSFAAAGNVALVAPAVSLAYTIRW